MSDRIYTETTAPELLVMINKRYIYRGFFGHVMFLGLIQARYETHILTACASCRRSRSRNRLT